MDYSEYTGNRASVSEYMHTVSDGVSLRIIDFTPYSIDPRKPVILFVAGWISLISGWKNFLAAVTPAYRVIYAETREKDSSLVPCMKRASFTMQRMMDDIADMVNGLIPQGTPFVIAGSSLGASAIMEYCMTDARRPMCAVLVGPNAALRFPRFLMSLVPFLHPSLYFAVKPIVKWYLRRFRVNSEAEKEQIAKYELTLDYANPYKLKRNALALKKWKLTSTGKIEIPSLVIGATTDSLHSTEHLKATMAFFTKGEYIELASNRETHSAKAAQVIMDFIETMR